MPKRPPRLTLTIAAYTAAALLFAAGAILWFVAHKTTTQAENDVASRAAFVTQVLLDDGKLEADDFARPVKPRRRKQLDALFARAGLLEGFERGTLINPAGIVTYSTYAPLDGRSLAKAGGSYEVALGGRAAREVGHLRDRFGEETGTKVLRSDLPIRRENAQPVGVVEIAQDYAVIERAANRTLYPVAVFCLIALLILGATLVPILRRVTAAVEVRNRRLVEQAATLERSLSSAQEARREAEAARRAYSEQNKRLRELDRLKDEFLSLVSHELRTPLTSIRGYLDLVLDGEAGALNPEQRRFLEAVERNSSRLLRLVGDLLFVAQADAGRLALDRQRVELAKVAADCVEAAEPAADSRSVRLVLSADPVPAIVGDRGRLAQVLDNLISNALKFTPEGGTVDVRTRADDEHAMLEVSDTGIGIPAEDQSRLFERFFRSSKAHEQAIPGTGLGLAIVKAIVEAHSGRIEVESREGEGTTFRVRLPLTVERRPSGEVEQAA
jgi:signal transduction histidine kinase